MGLTRQGRVVVRRTLRREKVGAFFARFRASASSEWKRAGRRIIGLERVSTLGHR